MQYWGASHFCGAKFCDRKKFARTKLEAFSCGPFTPRNKLPLYSLHNLMRSISRIKAPTNGAAEHGGIEGEERAEMRYVKSVHSEKKQINTQIDSRFMRGGGAT